MSDGPYKSLQMRRPWRLVAERAEKLSYDVAEISSALVFALEKDCRSEMSAGFVAALQQVADMGFFSRSDAANRFELLRPLASPGIGQAVLNYIRLFLHADIEGSSILRESLKAAIHERAYRCARQVEEHYLRGATAPRVKNVRDRIQQSIARADVGALATRVLGGEALHVLRAPAKQTGLDDGVTLP